jgi:APA family basic amino acid/polyamine antiporter
MPDRPAHPSAPQGHLRRVLGVAFGLAAMVGGTIGLGILRTPGTVAAQVQTPALFLGLWVLGGLYALLGANAVAELGAMTPRAGGPYTFAHRAFGPYVAFVVGWVDWLFWTGGSAASVLVVAEYLGRLVPALAGREAALAVALATGYTLLHWRGVAWGSRVQIAATLLKAAVFTALVAACFLAPAAAQAPAAGVAWPALAALVLALQGVIYTYDGWVYPAYFSEELREPGRDLPRAMIGGTVLVTVAYVLIGAALLHVLPIERIAGQELAVGTAVEALFGGVAGVLMTLVAIFFLVCTQNLDYLVAPRILYAMSRDEMGAPGGARVNEGGTPSAALFISALLIVAFALTGAFERVLAVLAFFIVANYTVMFLGVFALRRREPDAPRPYRAWGHPWTTGLVTLGSVAFLAGAVVADTRNSLYALGLLAGSYPVYLLFRARRRRRLAAAPAAVAGTGGPG